MTLRVGLIGSSSSATTKPGFRPDEFMEIERNFLTEGVVQGVGDEFVVTQRAAGANLSVDVGAGRALIEIQNTNVSGSPTYKAWFSNDATINKAIATADATHPRKDRVILRIDVSTNPNAASSNIAIVEVLTGTPGASPTAPAVPANAISRAVIDVPALDTAITDGQITNDDNFIELDASILEDVVRAEILASTDTGKGASMVGVEDPDDLFTGDTVEEVLAEIFQNSGAGTLCLIPDTGNPATVFGCSSVQNVLGATSIAFDAATVYTPGGGATSFTQAHTCTGSERLLFVGLQVGSASDTVSSVTYGGVAMTRIGIQTNTPSGETVYLYRLINPASGANNVVITLGSSQSIRASFASYTGCNQTTQPTTSTSGSASSATSFPITSGQITGSDWVVMFARNDTGNYGAGANTTLRGAANAVQMADSNGPGTYTLTLTSSSANHGGFITAICPARQNPLLRTFDFDQTSYEAAEWQFVLPSNYAGGTITAKVHWTTSAASGDAVWRLQGGAISDNEPLTNGLGIPVTVTDGSNGANDINVTATTPAITLSGTPSAGELCWIRISRDTADASDTLAADARLVGVELLIA